MWSLFKTDSALCEVRAEAKETADYLKNKNWDSMRCEIRSEAEETADDVITTIEHECKSSEHSRAGKTG
jgi:hypothetical protein